MKRMLTLTLALLVGCASLAQADDGKKEKTDSKKKSSRFSMTGGADDVQFEPRVTGRIVLVGPGGERKEVEFGREHADLEKAIERTPSQSVSEDFPRN